MTAGTLITILAAGWSVALLLAAWWAWGSVRSWWFSRGGKRAGTRYCRACSFDLTGLTRDETTPAKRCPECGAEIDRAGAVVVGKAITRRPKLKWAALAVALVTTLVFATLTVSRPPALWMHRMPDWVLVRTAKGGTNADAELALRELSMRWGFVSWMPTPWRVASITGLNYPTDALPMGGKQPPNLAAIAELAREALDRQSDRSRPWVPVWGQVIESAIALNLLDEQKRVRYQDNWINLTVTSRPKIRVGTKLPVSFAVTDVRTPRKVNLFMADEDLAPRSPSPGVSRTSTSYGVNVGNSSLIELSGAERLPIGVHDIEIEADVAASDKEVSRDYATPRRWKTRVEVVGADQSISVMYSVLDIEEAIPKAIIEAAIDLGPLPSGDQSSEVGLSVLDQQIRTRLWLRIGQRLPIDLAVRLEAFDPRRPAQPRLNLGKAVINSGRGHWSAINLSVDRETLNTLIDTPIVHLSLIGDSWHADSQASVEWYWGGRLELARVPISILNVPGVKDRPWPPSAR